MGRFPPTSSFILEHVHQNKNTISKNSTMFRTFSKQWFRGHFLKTVGGFEAPFLHFRVLSFLNFVPSILLKKQTLMFTYNKIPLDCSGMSVKRFLWPPISLIITINETPLQISQGSSPSPSWPHHLTLLLLIVHFVCVCV